MSMNENEKKLVELERRNNNSQVPKYDFSLSLWHSLLPGALPATCWLSPILPPLAMASPPPLPGSISPSSFPPVTMNTAPGAALPWQRPMFLHLWCWFVSVWKRPSPTWPAKNWLTGLMPLPWVPPIRSAALFVSRAQVWLT